MTNNPLRFIDPTGMMSADAAYSRNERFKADDPVRYYTEKIVNATERKGKLSDSNIRSQRQMDILQGEIDSASFNYLGKAIVRIATVKTLAGNLQSFVASGGLVAGEDIASAISDLGDELFDGDNPLHDLIGLEMDNREAIDDLNQRIRENKGEIAEIEKEIEEYERNIEETIKDEKEDKDKDDKDKKEPEDDL